MSKFLFPERLKSLRTLQNKSQKEFAEYLGIPQPSMSAYENGKNNPTIEVLVDIANKCNVSLDWLCGKNSDFKTISSMKDIVFFLYELSTVNEIGFEIEINDKESDKEWYASLKFTGKDNEHQYNADVCNILKEISNNLMDLNSYTITKSQYDSLKNESINYYTLPLTQKEFEELSRDERIKRHIEYLKKENMV